MFGMHALGKTTAVHRWKAKYKDRLDVYPLDDLRREYPGDKEKLELVVRCRESERVCVIESARGFSTWLGSFLPSEPVIGVWCTEPTARRLLMERRQGKPLTDYWSRQRLEYECKDRYGNFLRKRLTVEQGDLFQIEDRAKDWEIVDKHFASLFIRLYHTSKK